MNNEFKNFQFTINLREKPERKSISPNWENTSFFQNKRYQIEIKESSSTKNFNCHCMRPRTIVVPKITLLTSLTTNPNDLWFATDSSHYDLVRVVNNTKKAVDCNKLISWRWLALSLVFWLLIFIAAWYQLAV